MITIKWERKELHERKEVKVKEKERFCLSEWIGCKEANNGKESDCFVAKSRMVLVTSFCCATVWCSNSDYHADNDYFKW